MPVTLLGTQVPAIQVPAAVLNPDNPGSAMPAPFTALSGGETGPGSLSTPFNRNAKQAAAIAEGGGGGYGIETGLELSTAASLSLPISAGRANIRGRVTREADFTAAVSDGIARVYVWLSSAGTVTPVNNNLTPPAGEQLFLGSCVTAGGEITEVDSSGVMHLWGGALWRETADVGPPTDGLPTGITFFQKSRDGIYFWDGVTYRELQSNRRRSTLFTGTGLYVPAGEQEVYYGDLDWSLGDVVVYGSIYQIPEAF